MSSVIGLDIGASKWALADSKNPRSQVRGHISDDPRMCLSEISEALSLHSSKTVRLGISFPGSLSPGGSVESWPRRPSWVGYQLLEGLSGASAQTTVVVDDGICAAMGEKSRAAKGLNSYLCLSFGSGLGGVTVVDGVPRSARSGGARTFGHLRVPGSRISCCCGRRGCLQAVVLGDRRERSTYAELTARARCGHLPVIVSDFVMASGLDGVVLTGGLLGHVPKFAEFLREELTDQLAGSGCQTRISPTPHDSALFGSLDVATAAIDRGTDASADYFRS
ncbi:ROK family protein [Streptomyces asiaticus]|uniref:ROK family protein n=1 Tax=Streptomyces asiaticus TaxID=114695 RepID=UPI003F66424C